MKQICIVLVLSLTGCSFFMTRGPSDTNRPPRAYPSCTTSNTYPIVDTVLAGLFVLSMAAAIGEDDKSNTSFDDDEASKAEKVTSTAILAGVFGVSAFIGFSRTSKCRGSHESFQAAYPNGAMPYPYGQPYGYQPPPPAYPAAQQPYQPTPPQPYPGPQPQPYPGQQPAPPAPAPAIPTAQPAASALGTEGDVCSADSECSTGLTCRSNVCMRPPAKK